MAVPDARSSILRFFHIGSATVERVHTLPPARERSLAAGLGPALSRHDAEARSGIPLVASGVKPTRYYAQPGLIATLLEYRGKPVLLAEMGGDQAALTKKLRHARDPGRARRDRLQQPLARGRQARPDLAGGPQRRFQRVSRLAGNVLLWVEGDRTFRLEGDLTKGHMLQLARDITR